MIRSMTGFGVGENTDFRAEVRSVNHRHLDVHVKLPASYGRFEAEIKSRVRSRLTRGRVDVSVRCLADVTARVELNVEKARSVVDGLRRIQRALEIPGVIDIATLASIREIYEPPEENVEDGSRLFEVIEQALNGIDEMRSREGAALEAEVFSRIDTIENFFGEIRQLAGDHAVGVRTALLERVTAMAAGVGVDDVRLAQEVLFYTERADITEELVRADSHISQFRNILRGGGGVGRKLDFLGQEILREANTVASKSGEARVAHLVVEIKDQLEKVREQLQNIE